MSAEVFVDTNVLVYARDTSEAVKQPAAMIWMEQLWRSRRGRVSIQVLNEYFVTVTLKLKPGLPCKIAWNDVKDLFAWKPIPADISLLTETRTLHEKHQFSWWDAQIVAATGLSGCRYLLTEDLQDGQEFNGVRVINPFIHRAEEVFLQ
jgi:predicted nucleic acid-binding protein